MCITGLQAQIAHFTYNFSGNVFRTDWGFAIEMKENAISPMP